MRNQNIQQPRVRFAPSPTGFLHVGGARTALFNYLFVKHYDGKLILRIEDTDTERNRPEYEREILYSLEWLGIKWDEGPFYQSKRFDLYREYVEKLIARGRAYKCTCTPEEVEQMRVAAEAAGKKPMYDRRCRDKKQIDESKPYCVRFAAPLDGETVVEDLIKGRVAVANAEIDDFVILRTNNTPTYNLTVVVDDVDMQISHVIRAEEHLNNGFKQIMLIDALGLQAPQYGHIPLVLAPDKTKLSKRHGAVGVSQYKRDGFLSEALVNYLAKLGWGEKASDRELYTMAELVKAFTLEGCHAAGAVFDVVKLNWFNAQYIKQLSEAQIVERVKDQHEVDMSPLLISGETKKLLFALRDRATHLKDFLLAFKLLAAGDLIYDASCIETVLKPQKPGAVAALVEALEKLDEQDFVSERLAAIIKETVAKLGIKMPELGKPARVLLTGNLAGPDLGILMAALGKARTIERLMRYTQFCS